MKYEIEKIDIPKIINLTDDIINLFSNKKILIAEERVLRKLLYKYFDKISQDIDLSVTF